MDFRKTAVSLAGAAAIFAEAVFAAPASATIMVDETNIFSPYFSIDTSQGLSNFTADLGAQGYDFGSLSDAAQVDSASALILDLRQFNAALSTTEISNLSDFVASGRRVLIIGENDFWTTWDNNLLAFASSGTSSFESTYYGYSSPLVNNDLTAGINSIYLQAAGDNTGGGTQLFDQNFATLWGPKDNLLTVLDIDVFDDGYGNPTFENNVAKFLGSSSVSAAPEPSTWALMIAGAGIAGAALRFGRRSGSPATAQAPPGKLRRPGSSPGRLAIHVCDAAGLQPLQLAQVNRPILAGEG